MEYWNHSGFNNAEYCDGRVVANCYKCGTNGVDAEKHKC